jgi:hypothetical protein
MGTPRVRGLLDRHFGLRIGPRDPLPATARDGRPLYYRHEGAGGRTYCPACAGLHPVSVVDTYEDSSWPATSGYRAVVRFGLACHDCGRQMVPVRENCDGCNHLGEDTIPARVDGIDGLYCATCLAAADRPILDKTCWHCHRPFETRDPRQGLCPACERLADEDTRVTRIEGLTGPDTAAEVVTSPE